MFEILARELSKSIWKELGEEAAKKAIGSFIGEGIKAAFDVWKARQIKELDLEYKERQKKADEAEKAQKEAKNSEKPAPEESESPENPDIPENSEKNLQISA